MSESRTVRRELSLAAPVSGPLVSIGDVPDPTFAQKMVGDGVAVDPVSEVLLSPCEGTVTQLHSSHHALTVTTPDGIEVLLHIGLETVLLKGEGFTPLVSQGDSVVVGTPLIAFDAAFLARRASSLLTLMVVSNMERVAAVHPASGMAEAGVTPILVLHLTEEESTSGVRPPQEERQFSAVVIVPNPAGLHARPAAVLANNAKQFSSDIRLFLDGREANAKSVVSVLSLEARQHDRVTVSAKGRNADAALEKLVPLLEAGLGENLHAVPAPKPVSVAAPRPASGRAGVIAGVSASPGIVVGQVYQLRHTAVAVQEKGDGSEIEGRRLQEALELAQGELEALQHRMRQRADTDKAAIFAAHRELLEDPELLEEARRLMEQGKSAAFAWQAAFTGQAELLAGLNSELLAGRANDIRDIGRRVLRHLSGVQEEKADMPPNTVLIAEDLTPSDTAGLDKSRVVGFCTTGGSATSHASILARSMGLPAIAAIEERALELSGGQTVVLDGDKGELRLAPSAEEVERIRRVQEQADAVRKVELEEAARPAITRDGHRIKVVANIGGAADAEEVPALGGEGVGLLRSEFLFLQRADAPLEDEQAAVYAAVAKTLGPERDLVVRTLDVGGDKPLAYLPLPPEVNPFLGVRGIRLNLLGTELFRAQVRAVLQAAPLTRLHIMFPMVAVVEELREAKEIVLQEKAALGIDAPVQIGIMVEVPSAAVTAEGLAREADFFSIGTNDLTQYTLAVDRGHPRLAGMADALHPAVLRLVDMTVRGAHRHGKWVGVCGGLAGEVSAVPVLLGLGVDELSVSVSAIPAIKAAVRRLDMAACRTLAGEVLEMLTLTEVKERLAAFADEAGATTRETSGKEADRV